MRKSAWRDTILNAVLFLLVVVLLTAPSLAAEATEPDHDETEAPHEDSHFHRNHFSGIVGWSHKDTGKDSVTFGMDYSRMLTRQIFVNAYIELSEGDFQADTVGLLLGGYVTKHLSLFAGPGIERSLFEEKEYLGRVGLAYTFHPKGVAVTPGAWVDFVGGHKIYFVGVGVGKAF